MNEGGNTLDESIGIITAANEVVNDPSSVGTALKTLTLRLRGSKTELEEMGEDVSDMATTTSQLQAKLLALTGGQVDIMLDENTFKSSTQILREMAAAWEGMTDIQRASALELMGGKRQANVLSALISNFDTAEKAIEASANSAGSALRENEVYLDSIQGRIDLFNNSVQTMWKNALDDDTIKWFVNAGTDIVKAINAVVDSIGLLNTAIVAFAGSKLLAWILKATTGMNTFGQALQYIGMMLTSTKGVGAAFTTTIATQTKALWGAGVAGNFFTKSIKTAGIALKAFFSTPLGWLTAIAAAIMLTVHLVDVFTTSTAELQEELDGLKANLQDIQSDLDSVNSELETTQSRMAELIALPSLSFTEQEELDRLREQNEELERKERLLKAQEEREKKRVAEKAQETINSKLHDKSYNGAFWDSVFVGLEGALTGALAGAVTGSVLPGIGTAVGAILGGVGGFIGGVGSEHLSNRISTEDKLNEEIEGYEALIARRSELEEKFATASTDGTGLFGWGKSEYDKTKKELENLEKEIGETEAYIDQTLSELGTTLDGVEYGYGADEALDTYYNALYKWEIEAGTIGAESDGLAHIFSRPEHKVLKEGIDNYIASLKEGESASREEIEKIIDNNDALAADIHAMGLEISDAVDYFTMDGSGLSADIIANYEKGLNALDKFKDNKPVDFTNDDGTVENIGFENLFDEEGEILSGQVSKIMQGADETTRKEFEKLMKAVKDGKYNFENEFGNIDVDWESVTKSWNISGGLRVIEEEIAQLSQINLEVFPGLEGEIDGIIDSFDELISAVSDTVSAMDALEQARAEEAYSGSVSLETLEKLMQSTDNYAELIEVDETGAITLATDAQDLFIQEKIQTIKQNAALALSQAQLRLEEAKHNQQIYQNTSPAQEVLRSALAEVGGAAAFVTSLWGDLTSGNLVGAWDRAKEARTSAISEKKQGWAAQAAEATTSVAEAEKAVANAQKMNDIAQGLTKENIKSRSDSSTASGGNSTVKDVENDRFQKEMDYWENRIAANQSKYEQIQSAIDMLEKKGKIAGKEYYEEQRNLEVERYALLLQQKEEAKSMLSTFKEGSDEWWEVANTLNDIENELCDVSASIQDLDDAIDQIHWDVFDEAHGRFGNLIGQLGTIRDLLSADEDSFFDDEGNWTENGVAVLGTYIQEIEIYKNALDDVNEEIANLKLSDFDSEQEYYDKLTELTEKQHDYATTISDSEQAVVDMYASQIDAIEEYTSELVDSYNDYIDVVKEALDAERDLYDFKKNIKKQTKDIASLERRIASLSGSSSAADIAERRKLEAELYDAKEGLNDTYYDHAKDAQSEALDREASAYEKSMTSYIDTLRDKLAEAKLNMDLFMEQVTTAVVTNAGTVLEKYQETEVAMSEALTQPWQDAIDKIAEFGGEEGSLASMNDWTKAGENGFVYNFSTSATEQLKSPWAAGTTAVNSFKSSTATAMSDIVKDIKSNVVTATGELNKIKSLYASINDTTVKAPSGNGGNGDPPANPTKPDKGPQFEKANKYVSSMFTASPSVFGSGTVYTDEKTKKKYYLIKNGPYKGYYIPTGSVLFSGVPTKGTVMDGAYLYTKKYAKGTMGTPRDEWALTDELGDELVLVPGANGNLSFMRKGTSVVPADITANLVEWGKLNPDMLKVGGGVNINMISNAVIKPDLNFEFDSLVHVDHCDEGTLKDLEKMVDNKINQFSKQMNYALKRIGGR